MRIVAALGGNALLRRGQSPDAEVQEANVLAAAAALAPLAERHEVVLTHGNGPQVGVLALESASDPHLSAPYPLDVLGAQTQGMIGYWLLQAMQNALPGRQVAAIINQTLVAADDPAFADPTKFVGEVYDEAEARALAQARGWVVKPDGDRWRRVVGSPVPQRVVETRLIRLLLLSGAVVVCAGGGGVPVIRNEQGRLEGVEAVVDKDRTASVLAEALEADVLLVLTDVPCVVRGYGTPGATPIMRATPAALRREEFPAGSMGPKVDAVCRFVELTGDMAAIGRLEDAEAILRGEAGTVVTPSGTYPEPRGPKVDLTGLPGRPGLQGLPADHLASPGRHVVS
ncbi:MAG: carbamate kinase [Acidimicrobiales bacterium]